MRDGAAAAPENLDIVCAFFAQKIDNGRKKFDVPAVVTRDANRPHIFLDGGTDDVAYRAVIAEINHFDPVPDEFQVDRVDRAIVTITNRDCGQNSNGRRHFFQEITTNLESRKTGKLTKSLSCVLAFVINVHRFESLAVASRPLQRRLQICINWSIVAAIVSLLPDFLLS